MTYWKWFFHGTGARPGYRRVFNRWLLAHGTVPVDLKSAANTVLLPLVGILIGLSFAWAGNAQALLGTREIEMLASYHPGGFEEYVYTYQTAILLILATVCAWGLAGLGVFDRPSPVEWGQRLYPAVSTVLYSLVSLALRECWHVVLAAQLLLIVRKRIRDAGDGSEDNC